MAARRNPAKAKAPEVARCSRLGRRPPRRPIVELGEDERFADLSVVELRKRLKFAGQPTSGTKAELLVLLRACVARAAVGKHTRSHRSRGTRG